MHLLFKRAFFLLTVVVLTACNSLEEVPLTDWVQHADFPGTPRASACSFVIGDQAFVCCGRTGLALSMQPKDSLNEVWRYDSSTDTWSQLDTFPGQPRVLPVGVSINGKGYVGMGSSGTYNGYTALQDFYEFDPQTGRWTQKANFPGKASNNLAYAVVGGCLYTTIGYDGFSKSYETYRYDPSTNVWTRMADVPHAYMVPAYFSLDDRFYVGSGFQGRNIDKMLCYDTQTNQWSSVASLPKGRMLSNGLAIGNKGYILLGRYWNGVENNGRLLRDVLEYDPATNVWTSRGEFPGTARQNAVVFTINGRGYVVMGENDYRRLGDVWSFKP